MAFTSDLLVQRTVVGQRVSVKEQGKRLVRITHIQFILNLPQTIDVIVT